MKLTQVVAAAAAGVILLGVGFWVGGATAGGTDPGSSADPLVSQSYVDQKATDLSSRMQFQQVNLPMGSSLIAESGTEFVLRGGKATMITTAKGGVMDVTAGVDLPNGTPVPANHLLLIPYTDGRGALATTDAIFIVKGTYTVKPAGQ